MKVFLSWSGSRSKDTAASLHKWLPAFIHAAKPWFSPEDIGKGAPWLAELTGELATHSFAIVCLTPENLDAPWLLFEAGILSKALITNSVCPLLIGLAPTDVKGPLAQFQATRAEKEDMRALFSTMNRRLGDQQLNEAVLEKTFEKFWPELEECLLKIAAAPISTLPPPRSEIDMLTEVVEKVRSIERSLTENASDYDESDDSESGNADTTRGGYGRSPYGGGGGGGYGGGGRSPYSGGGGYGGGRSPYGGGGGGGGYGGGGGRSPYGGGNAGTADKETDNEPPDQSPPAQGQRSAQEPTVTVRRKLPTKPRGGY